MPRQVQPSRKRRARSAAYTQKLLDKIKSRELQEFENITRRALAKAIQSFAVNSMNSLAQAGPAWTGEFSASWGFAPEGREIWAPGSTGKIYRYTKYDVLLKDVIFSLKNGETRFLIANIAPHAARATDEEEGMFWRPSHSLVSIKLPVQEGWGRPDDVHLRYQMKLTPLIDEDTGEEEEPTSSITAKKDWYINYVKGGGLQNDLNIAFKSFI